MEAITDVVPSWAITAAATYAGTVIFSKAVQRMLFAWPTPSKGAAVFITGSGTGIGNATALEFAKAGYQVFAGVISQEEGEKIIKQPGLDGGNVVPIVCDVTKPEDCRRAAETVKKATNGRLWGLVNNAGANTADGPVEFVPLDRVRRVFEINTMGIYHVCQAFLPLVRACKGRVVNIASVNGFFTWTDHTPYCVSKHGVEALTDGLRLELEPFGVHVSVVEPGGIDTPIFPLTFKMIEDCGKEMGEACHKVYGKKDVEICKKRAKMLKLSPPSVIGQAVFDAITAPNPKIRYTVGAGAGLFSFLKRWLPDRGFHHFVRIATGNGVTRPVPKQQD